MKGDTHFWIVFWYVAEEMSGNFGVPLTPQLKEKFRAMIEERLAPLLPRLKEIPVERTFEDATKDLQSLLQRDLPTFICLLALEAAKDDIKKAIIDQIDFQEVAEAIQKVVEQAELESEASFIRGLTN